MIQRWQSKFRQAVPALILAGLLASSAQAAPPVYRPVQPKPISSASLEGFVDGTVRNAMAADHIAGVSVAIVQNGAVVLKKGYGYGSFDPVRPVDADTTLFRLGSITKTFTWILALKEVEAGRMRLDAPINLYLPEKLQVRDGNLLDGGFDQPVLLHHLMSHSAGFEDRALGQLMERNPKRERSLFQYLRQERPARVRPPGLVPAYSNYGAGLAGMAVANVMGRPIESLAETEIFQPLGMSRTSLREPRPNIAGLEAPLDPTLARDLSQGYRWRDGGFEPRPFEYVGHLAPAGSGSSTASDMARYMVALLDNGRSASPGLFGSATAEAIRSPHFRGAPGAAGWNHGFMEVPVTGGFAAFGHSGDTFAFHANMVLVPELGLGIFVATNTETGADLADHFPNALIQSFFAQPKPPRPADPALAASRNLYDGHYMTTRRAYHWLEGFVDRLAAVMEVRVSADGYLITRTGDRTRRWVPDGAPDQGRFRAVEGPESLIFVMGPAGATSVIAPWGGEAFERVGPLEDTRLLIPLVVLVAIAALATLGGMALRNRRDIRQTPTQSIMQMIQAIQSLLLLLALLLFGVWAQGISDLPELFFRWPSAWVFTASTATLVSAVLAVVTLIMLPEVWQGGRRVDSWTAWRKGRFTLTALLYTAFGLLLFHQGALIPWS